MIEEIDTNSNFDNKKIPNGIHDFTILDIRKAKSLYVYELSYDVGEKGDQTFFANTMGPLLKVLGCKETAPGKYAFNSDELKGKKFSAEVYQEPDKDNPDVIRQRMRKFDELPF